MEKLLGRPMEVAEALGISRSQVYAMLASGALPSVRFGKTIRVPLAALHTLLELQALGSHGKGGSDEGMSAHPQVEVNKRCG